MSWREPGFLMSTSRAIRRPIRRFFLRLRAGDAVPREIAWDEFNTRYAPIIAGFARRLAARTQDVDDVVQMC